MALGISSAAYQKLSAPGTTRTCDARFRKTRRCRAFLQVRTCLSQASHNLLPCLSQRVVRRPM